MAKKPLPAALIGILVLLIGAALTWASGFLYWQLRISRTVKAAREEARKLPPEDWTDDPGFRSAGSRVFPRLLAELDRAILDRDRPLASRYCQDLAMQTRHIHDHLDSPYFVPQATYIKIDASWESYSSALKQCEEWWTQERPHYPPWWMWWSGTRRDP